MEGLIRFARPSDIPALKSLWQKAFDDTPEGTLFYFARRHLPPNMLVYEAEGQPVAMLTMLPVTLHFAGEARPGRYIFAVATDEGFRGKGLSTRLLEAAHQHMRDQGDAAAVLAPAEKSLFSFYEKRGYQTTFYADHALIQGEDLPPYAGLCREATVQEHQALRDQAFAQSRLYVAWDEPALAYAMTSTRLYGGVTLYAQDGGMAGSALCEWLDDHRVRITDMALEGMLPLHLLAALHSRLQAKEYHLRVAEGLWPGADKQPLGMMYPLQPLPAAQGTPPYLALIKD